MANVSKILASDGTTYDINANTVSGHIVASDVPANGITYYGTSVTGASTVNKKATCTDFTMAMTDCPAGTSIRVKFSYGNTAENPTLNVNSKGAKPIIRTGTEVPGNNKGCSWSDGSIITFTYDGTNWLMNDVTEFANNIAIVEQNPSSLTSYLIPFVNDGFSSQTYNIRANDGLVYRTRQGTTSDTGFGLLILGNTTVSGTAGNKAGVVRLYDTDTTGYLQLSCNDFEFTSGTNTTWDGSNRSIMDAFSSITSMLNGCTIKCGTVTKTIAANQVQRCWSMSELSTIFGGATLGSGSLVCYVMNGDRVAQETDVVSVSLNSSSNTSTNGLYVRFSSTPAAGSYRFNYIFIKFA